MKDLPPLAGWPMQIKLVHFPRDPSKRKRQHTHKKTPKRK